MARIRTIKPEFWKHEALSELPADTHMLAVALLTYADDEGYFNANPRLIQAECCPLRELFVSIPESLRSLQTAGYIDLGTGDDGRQYGRVCNFAVHQRVSHPTPSKISCKSIAWEQFESSPEKFRNAPETFVPEQGTGNREQGKEITTGAQKRAVPKRGSRIPDDWQPTPDDLAFAHEQGFSDDEITRHRDEFVDYWLGESGQRASKVEWSRTFRNRLRAIADRANGRSGGRAFGQRQKPVSQTAIIRSMLAEGEGFG